MSKTMRNRFFISLAMLLLLPLSAGASIKCWTNKDGYTECGNVVPPEYAQQETRTIDRRGITTEVRPRAPTADEVKAQRQRQAEEERRQAEEEQRRREQEQYDQMLLNSYLSDDDIIRTRDRMTTSLNAAIELNRINIERLEERLAAEQSTAARHERGGRDIPERVKEEIESLKNQIEARQAQIQVREQERDELHQRYDAELQRFRELQQMRR